MTSAKVRKTFGTPLIVDAFNRNRWDYVYNSYDKSKNMIELTTISIFIEDGKVSKIERKSNIKETEGENTE